MIKEFTKGLWKENPIFVQVLGMCPTLAVTTKALFGFSMGMATTFVVVSSSVVISLIRRFVPREVRIPMFTVIIATFVTAADYFLKANLYQISKALGPYVPLIVVNCIILGRAEAFASKNNIARSFLDALGMGVGFTCALIILGSVRELLGSGTVFGYAVMWGGFTKWVIMVLPAGAFLTLGLLVGLFNVINSRMVKKAGCK
ncbi:MAG: electron transport complex subunit E [Candidatus Omnitrophica bacterium]|nr:electron transport complex subunit E [Candidatus Omnitrophota bacterium]MBU1128032.1 electron transport complex subunit E [Candidatus Omnitrophota bacterium]MBU1784530.1 electron transport complex subunit E [Candidatus Omnitrophota bacterium]MBU1851128.1 electron transport complex subunit E [Candidatus Omnitrophota bacterium]